VNTRSLLALLVLLLAACDSDVEWSTVPLCGHGIEGVASPWRARLHRSVRAQITGWECRLSDASEPIRLVAPP
jgi:hypothetical protein